MITREQIADLQPGDVVRLVCDTWPTGTALEGAVSLNDAGVLILPLPDRDGQYWVRNRDGNPFDGKHRTLTVISRTPRPLYVNHPRRKPVPGDVAALDTDPSAIWGYDFEHDWLHLTQEALPLDAGVGMRLLVDGETGEVVR